MNGVASAMGELCDLSAIELRHLIGQKAISPVDLLESCIARIEAVDPAVNALVTPAFDAARAEAKAAESAVMSGQTLAPLHGLPLAVKDTQDTAGLLTTYGSPRHADNVPNQDAPIVARLRTGGAIVLGKTNAPEFGAGANTTNDVFGATRNPFDLQRTCGGSSGGSAVALATGMAPLATGSDHGGSLRIPASFCGVSGFRTSPGLVSDPDRRFGWSPTVIQGVMARTVPDLASALAHACAFERLDPLAAWGAELPPARLNGLDLSTLKVAYSPDLKDCPIDPRIGRAFVEKMEKLSPVFARCQNDHPDMEPMHRAFDTIRAELFLADFKEIYETEPDTLGPNVKANVEIGLNRTMGDAVEASLAQTDMCRRLELFLSDHDVLLCPATTVPPFPIDQLYLTEVNGVELETYYRWFAITYAFSLTGHPVAVIPFGLDPTGTPMGLQIVGQRGRDGYVLQIAAAIEEAAAGIEGLERPVPRLETLTS